MRNPEDVVAELNSWENVADELYKRGVKGTRDHCHACPIATFLCDETGWNTEVDATNVVFTDPNDTRRPVEFCLSEQATRFIYRFDDGEFPDLDLYPVDLDQDEY